MSLRRLKPYLTVFILLSMLLPSIVTASQQKIHPKTFQQTIDELQRLINRDDCSAKEMRQIAHDFVELHKREKGINRTSSFYFAGKAYLNLYRLSGDTRHIDKCITYLNNYKKAPQHSKHYREALFDLKEAYLLKRKNKEFTTPGKTPSKSKKVIEEASPRNSVMSSLTQTPENKPKAVDSSDQTREIAQPSYNFALRTHDRTPMNRAGNPFFVADQFESIVPQPLEPRIKSAAIIPPSVTDAKSGSDIPEIAPPKNSHVVVIDPGHGGKDPGAISYDRKVTEKEVALDLSKLIKENLKKLSPNVKVFLTRNDDTFLTLKERAKIANSHGADVFISVHCNGSDFKSANGPEIFYLSKSSSRGAMRAAARENGVSLSKMTDLEATLIDLLTTSKNSESTKLAQVVHNYLIATDATPGIKFRDRGVKQAPFYVLIGATMPAILVECGFVNSLAQQAPDSRDDFIKSVALKLASGTMEYLRKLPANPH